MKETKSMPATAKISKQTEEKLVPIILAMAKSGLVAASEARAAALLIHDGTKAKTETKPTRKVGLLTTKQVAEVLQCSRKTVLRMSNDGQLTRRYLRRRNPKSLRFLLAEVSALCDPHVGSDQQADNRHA